MALLAGLPQAPSVYSPFNNIELAKKRRNQVLLRMYKMKYIDKATMEKAQAEKIHLTSMPTSYLLNKAPYFCDMIMNELEKLGFSEQEISQGGYKIITTLDYKTQIKANEAIVTELNAYGLRGDKNQAAVFAFSPVDGKILAYAGGKDYAKSQYDRVTQAVRPPGSAFKPFIYTAAVEKGVSPNDLIDDKPFKAGTWTPHNYGNRYRGQIPVYKALMISSNVAAVRMIQEVGIRSVIQTARVLGIETPLEYDYTIALGSNGVKLFEFTRAFGAFANGGYIVQPYAVERIETSRGKVIYRAPKTKISHQLSLKTAAQMTAMMRTVITNGTGRAANIGVPAAGKTGTTDDNRDAYFVGYTPNIVTGVWVGNDENGTTRGNIYGGTAPAIIWHDVMKVGVQPYGSLDFNYPEVKLLPFSLSTGLIKNPEEEEEKEATETENPEAVNPATHVDPSANVPAMTPADVVKNFRFRNSNNNSSTGTNTTPQAAPQPAVSAPTPIPMAVPETLR